MLSNSILSKLANEYGLQEAEAKLFLPGMWIVFRNATTEVTIQFEYASGMWVTIGRLATFQGRVVGGEHYNLEAVLSLRAPNRQRRKIMREFDAGEFAEILENYAAALKLHADDILRGDFECFERLKKEPLRANRIEVAEKVRLRRGSRVSMNGPVRHFQCSCVGGCTGNVE